MTFRTQSMKDTTCGLSVRFLNKADFGEDPWPHRFDRQDPQSCLTSLHPCHGYRKDTYKLAARHERLQPARRDV